MIDKAKHSCVVNRHNSGRNGSASGRRSSARRAAVALCAAIALLALAATTAPAAAPTVTVNPASEVGYTTAKASGDVDPQGKYTSYYFEYLSDAQFQANLDNGDPGFNGAAQAGYGEGESLATPEATLEGLVAATTYHLRLLASNEDGPEVAVGPDFTTQAATAPVLALDPAGNVEYTTAHISGTIDPEGGNVDPLGGPIPIIWQLEINYAGEWTFAEGGVISAEEPEGGGEIPALSTDPIAVEANLAVPPNTLVKFRLKAYYAGEERTKAGGEFTTQAVTPPLVLVADAGSITGTTADFAGEVTAGGTDPAFTSSCAFDYVTQKQFEAGEFDNPGAASAVCAPETIEGAAATPVSAAVTGLQPHTTYHLRLRSTNQGGTSTEAAAPFTTEALAPTIASTSVEAVGANEATLIGKVVPGGAPTTYHFQYVSEAQFGAALEGGFAKAISTPESAPVGEDNVAHVASAVIGGLQPNTTYHYRVIATNSKGSAEGPDRAFDTLALSGEDACPNAAIRAAQGAQGLADCRAYEQVSPVDKNGGDVMGDSTRTRAAAAGDAVSFMSLSAFGDAAGTGIGTDYMSVRHPDRWATHAITPPQQGGGSGKVAGWQPLYQGEFSADLSKGVFKSFSPVTDAPNVAFSRNMYLRDDLRIAGAGGYQLLTDSAAPQLIPPITGLPAFADASSDFTHILFEAPLNLTADASPQPVSCSAPPAGEEPSGCRLRLYEWDTGTLRLAGVLPDTACASPPCPAASSAAGRGASGGSANYTQGTISDDGRRVFFTAPVRDDGDAVAASQTYMRVDHASTVQVSASEVGGPEQMSSFQMATPDGGKVYFISAAQLTDAPGSGLYVYDAEQPDSSAHNLTLLAAGDVSGVVGVGDDGGYVYFIATDQLAPEAPATLDKKLYVWHEETVRYIGSLEAVDADANQIDLNSSQGRRTARVLADGTRLMFVSHSGASLSGNVHSSGCLPIKGRDCSEVYLYDARANGGAGELSCVSCDLSGDPVAITDAGPLSAVGIGAIPPSQHLNHALSDDGRRVFFTSGNRLVPDDQNGTVPDVYEYDTASKSVRMLSNGRGTAGSYFLDASAGGDDVFFITRERLVAGDVDGAYDLYDARAGGGFPEPAPPGPQCAGEACQGALGNPPSFDAPSSSSVTGLGNPKAPVVKNSLTRAQKLNRALRKCKAKRQQSQRKKCESQARKHFGSGQAPRSRGSK